MTAPSNQYPNVLGYKLPLFPYIYNIYYMGWVYQPNSRGLYTNHKGFPIESGKRLYPYSVFWPWLKWCETHLVDQTTPAFTGESYVLTQEMCLIPCPHWSLLCQSWNRSTLTFRLILIRLTPLATNMTQGKFQPFEDVFPITYSYFTS